jgi:hypothetical protein
VRARGRRFVVSLLIADAMCWFEFTVAVVAASSDSNDMIS